MDLDSPDPGALCLGEDFHLAPHRHAARNQRPGDHGAETAHGEGPVHRQPEGARGVAGPGGAGCRRERAAKLVEPRSGLRGHRDERRFRHRRAGEQFAHLEGGDLDELRVLHEVDPGQRHDRGTHAEQAADLDVFARLGHHRLVRGHDQQHHVEPGGAGQHVAHEPLVAGNVHEAVVHVLVLEVRETEVHGDAAGLFLLQPVRVGAGEREHQRTLPVVDVAGGAHDHVSHIPRV